MVIKNVLSLTKILNSFFASFNLVWASPAYKLR